MKTTKPSKPAEPEPESEEQIEQKAKAQRKEQALKEKEQGNDAYKAKKFDEAITHYDKAHELYDEDISFLTNRWVLHNHSCGLERMQQCYHQHIAWFHIPRAQLSSRVQSYSSTTALSQQPEELYRQLTNRA